MRFRSLPSRAELIWLIAIIYESRPAAGGNTRSHYVSRLKAELKLSRRLNGQAARILAHRRHLTSAVGSRRGVSPNFGDFVCVDQSFTTPCLRLCGVCLGPRPVMPSFTRCHYGAGSKLQPEIPANLSEYLPAFSPWLSQARTSVCPCTADPPKPSSDGLRYKNTHTKDI